MKLKFVTLIAAIVALVFSFIPLGSVLKSVKIKKSGIQTESTVSDVSRRGKGLPTVTVAFNTSDGNQVLAKAAARKYLTAGDKVMIYYDPAIPTKIDFGDTIGYNMRGVIIGGLIFFFCFFYFIRYSLSDKANKSLISSGMKIDAEFVSVERNEKYRMGDKNPWVIKCRWIDNRNNREYYFVSKDYIIDPAPYLNGRTHLDVFVHPDDPGNYFMDTSFMPKGNNTIG
jgi:hypothetical protein